MELIQVNLNHSPFPCSNLSGIRQWRFRHCWELAELKSEGALNPNLLLPIRVDARQKLLRLLQLPLFQNQAGSTFVGLISVYSRLDYHEFWTMIPFSLI